jgi:hypothetical protein
VDDDRFQLGVFAIKKKVPYSHAQGKGRLTNDAHGGICPRAGKVRR